VNGNGFECFLDQFFYGRYCSHDADKKTCDNCLYTNGISSDPELFKLTKKEKQQEANVDKDAGKELVVSTYVYRK
jgi:hypothetical protein